MRKTNGDKFLEGQGYGMALLNVSENMNVIFKRWGNEKVNTDEVILAFYSPQKIFLAKPNISYASVSQPEQF